jgi:hypothetical protein
MEIAEPARPRPLALRSSLLIGGGGHGSSCLAIPAFAGMTCVFRATNLDYLAG